MPSKEILPLISMGAEMFLFDNSVLNMYLLNKQLNFYKKKSCNYFLFYMPDKTICRKYVIIFVNTLLFLYHTDFHSSTLIRPRLRLGLIWASLNVTRAEMEKSCINFYLLQRLLTYNDMTFWFVFTCTAVGSCFFLLLRHHLVMVLVY